MIIDWTLYFESSVLWFKSASLVSGQYPSKTVDAFSKTDWCQGTTHVQHPESLQDPSQQDSEIQNRLRWCEGGGVQVEAH